MTQGQRSDLEVYAPQWNRNQKTKNSRLNVFEEEWLDHLDLEGFDLQNITFLHCRFHGSDFTKARLNGANFYNCDLSSAKGLTNNQFRDCSLTGSNLPEAIDFEKKIEHINEAAKFAKVLYFFIITGGFAALLAASQLTPFEKLIEQNVFTLPFPQFKVPVPMVGSMIVLACLVITFKYYLLIIFSQARSLPRIFTDGLPLDETISPWFVSASLSYFKRRKVLTPTTPSNFWKALKGKINRCFQDSSIKGFFTSICTWWSIPLLFLALKLLLAGFRRDDIWINGSTFFVCTLNAIVLIYISCKHQRFPFTHIIAALVLIICLLLLPDPKIDVSGNNFSLSTKMDSASLLIPHEHDFDMNNNQSIDAIEKIPFKKVRQLSGRNFSKIRGRGTFFTGSLLSGTTFRDAELQHACFAFTTNDLTRLSQDSKHSKKSQRLNFTGSKLHQSDFKGSSYDDVILDYAELQDSDFTQSSLNNASFKGVRSWWKQGKNPTSISQSTFSGDISDLTFLDLSQNKKPSQRMARSRFKDIYMLDTYGECIQLESFEGELTLSRVHFLNGSVIFRQGSLTQASFSEVILNSMTFENLKFESLTVSPTSDLSNSQFLKCTIDNGSFAKCDLTGTSFVGSKIGRVNFAGASMVNTAFWGVDLSMSKGLTAEQVLEMCIDEYTVLPPDLQKDFDLYLENSTCNIKIDP